MHRTTARLIPVITVLALSTRLVACSIEDLPEEGVGDELHDLADANSAEAEADEADEDEDGVDDDDDDDDGWDGSASYDDDEGTELEDTDELTMIDRSNVKPGEPLEIMDGVFVTTPAPGEGVLMEIFYEDGNTYLVDVSADTQGNVQVRSPATGFTAGQTDPTASTCPSKCSDNAYKLDGFKWTKKMRWSYRDKYRPSSVGKQATIDALNYSVRTITKSRNSCSLDDRVSARQSYLGETTTAPNISFSNGVVSCKSSDGKNVIGWGSLPSTMLAVACTWRSNGVASSSDQRYNRNYSWFAGNSVPSGCNNRFSLRAVAAHEFGHTFGLNHSRCHQTMAPSKMACKSGSRRLGRGDVLGLRKLYPL